VTFAEIKLAIEDDDLEKARRENPPFQPVLVVGQKEL
jgi:hypothetical protein